MLNKEGPKHELPVIALGLNANSTILKLQSQQSIILLHCSSRQAALNNFLHEYSC